MTLHAGLSLAFRDADASPVQVAVRGIRNHDLAPVTRRTAFALASLSKPVTALVVLRLVAAGLLDLDADVNGYLDGWTLRDTDGARARVSLRHLLAHRAATTVS